MDDKAKISQKKAFINIFARISPFIPNDYDIDWYPILDGLYLFLTIVAAAYAMEDEAMIAAQIIKVTPGWPWVFIASY